jgi:hypothetical protein
LDNDSRIDRDEGKKPETAFLLYLADEKGLV